MEEINVRIRKYRENAKMTQKEAGEILGLKSNAYSTREAKGKFSVDEVIALAKAMNVDANLIIYGENKLDFSAKEPQILMVNDPFKENPFIKKEPQLFVSYQSGDFEITNEEKDIVKIFRNLDDEGKNAVRQLLSQLK